MTLIYILLVAVFLVSFYHYWILRNRAKDDKAFRLRMKNFDRKRDNRGSVLIAVLIITFLMMYLSTSFLRLALNDMKLSQMAEESARAFYAAEAGLEKAYLDLIHTERSGKEIWKPNPEKEYIYSEEGENLRPAYFEVTLE